MFLTSSPRIASHSTGWKAMRLIADRAWKRLVEPVTAWGRHRELNTDDLIRATSAAHAQALTTIRETRP